MSWSFACLILKEGSEFAKFTYCVCVDKCSQDWWSNSAIFHAVLRQMKIDHPHVTCIIHKHDNASSYHNIRYWNRKREIADSLGRNLLMTLMNEPCQG